MRWVIEHVENVGVLVEEGGGATVEVEGLGEAVEEIEGD